MRFVFGLFLLIVAAVGAGDALAQGRQDFSLVNRTGYVISEVYVAPSSSSNWEEDVLGRDVLGNGESVHITFSRSERSCQWDLKVVWDDNSSSEWSGFDLCQVSNIALFYDRGSDRAWAESN